ncbi:MAG: GTPase Era [Betaproteobacteria bacterium TMED156]|nr:MAG: GTPase Era [Betaproteobacteria bacterium TMED156]
MGQNINQKNITNDFRCGYVAIVGRPNVGKSSLINKLIGQPISIISRRKQTTVDCILGVVNQNNLQLVLIDTPGIEFNGKLVKSRRLNNLATSILSDVDVILWVIEAKKIHTEDELIPKIFPKNIPIVVAINKVDLANSDNDKRKMFEQVNDLSDINIDVIIPISVSKSFQITQLIDEIKLRLPIRTPIFDKDFLTDKDIVFRTSEIIREKVFKLIGDELPYTTFIEIDRLLEEEVGRKIVTIDASIITNRMTHKPIVIGKKGMTIKRIKEDSLRPLRKLFDRPVKLNLWVKVRQKFIQKSSY